MIAKTAGALALLQLALPVNALVTAALVLRNRRKGQPASEPRRKTVLLTGGKMTKALHLARTFHRAGHRVVLVESAKYRFTGHRFSAAVDRFHTVPDSDSPGYGPALLAIVRRERVDVFVPVCSPASSHHDALVKPLLEPYCEVLHGDAATVADLDDKHRFVTVAAGLGLPVPDSHRITTPQQVAEFDFGAGPPYILKSIPYDPLHRLDLTTLPRASAAATAAFAAAKPISADTPWIMQQFVRGQEFCVHTTARAGVIGVYVCCPSSAFQLNYEVADEPAIEAWVRGFVEPLGLTGQFSFDLIRTPSGAVFPIECNPRTHTAITVFDDYEALSRAYLEDGAPMPAAGRPTYWLYHELWQLLRDPRTLPQRLRILARGRDAIFDPADPLPFLLAHHLHLPLLLLRALRTGRDWVRIDFNIGKIVEPAGD